MNDSASSDPILNSPYDYPARHWELDNGQPTGNVVEGVAVQRASLRRSLSAKKKAKGQTALAVRRGQRATTSGISSPRRSIDIRARVDGVAIAPRIPRRGARHRRRSALLQHWRTYNFSGARPFFCQVEAVETVIWLTEVAPQEGARGKMFSMASPRRTPRRIWSCMRMALKLATGAGKTTVMAMIGSPGSPSMPSAIHRANALRAAFWSWRPV